MARLSWSTVGQRYFETGVDRGVLYVDNLGVAWNGLTAVNETPSGGDPEPYYLDGYKYLNIASMEEFEASIDAFSAPPEFNVCDGTVAVGTGLFATQQPRKQFGFSYRTKIGNDTEGLDLGYKIHLVYNALAKPASRSYSTLNDSPDPTTFSWDITTLPPYGWNIRPTAHFIIDSRSTPPALLAQLEAMFYGTDTTQPTLPTVLQIQTLFMGFLPFKIIEETTDAYNLYSTSDEDGRAFMGPVAPSPLPNGEPLLWLDTSIDPGYVVPKLISGG